jgi:hypothetical protein
MKEWREVQWSPSRADRLDHGRIGSISREGGLGNEENLLLLLAIDMYHDLFSQLRVRYTEYIVPVPGESPVNVVTL